MALRIHLGGNFSPGVKWVDDLAGVGSPESATSLSSTSCPRKLAFMGTLPSSTFTGFGAFQENLAPVVGPMVTIQEIRDSLSLARIKVGAALELIETAEYDAGRLSAVNAHAETIAYDAEMLFERISHSTNVAVGDPPGAGKRS